MNDNKPVFAQTVYEVDVDEDADVGFAILTVSANDEDEGKWWRGRKYIPVILTLPGLSERVRGPSIYPQVMTLKKTQYGWDALFL